MTCVCFFFVLNMHLRIQTLKLYLFLFNFDLLCSMSIASRIISLFLLLDFTSILVLLMSSCPMWRWYLCCLLMCSLIKKTRRVLIFVSSWIEGVNLLCIYVVNWTPVREGTTQHRQLNTDDSTPLTQHRGKSGLRQLRKEIIQHQKNMIFYNRIKVIY